MGRLQSGEGSFDFLSFFVLTLTQCHIDCNYASANVSDLEGGKTSLLADLCSFTPEIHSRSTAESPRKSFNPPHACPGTIVSLITFNQMHDPRHAHNIQTIHPFLPRTKTTRNSLKCTNTPYAATKPVLFQADHVKRKMSQC